MIDDRHSPNGECAVLYELKLKRVHFMLNRIYNTNTNANTNALIPTHTSYGINY